MNELPFMEQFNSKLMENEKIFKFRSAQISNGIKITIEFLVNSYLYNEFLDNNLKIKVEKIIKSILPKGLILNIRYIKTITTSDLLRKALFEFIIKEKPTFYENFLGAEIDIEITPSVNYINITLEKFLCDYAKSSDLGAEIIKELSNDFIEDIEIIFTEIPNKNEACDDFVIEKNEYMLRFVDAQITTALLGSITLSPRYIVDVKDKAYSDVCLCGVISDINEKFIEKLGKNIFTFKLYDTTASINCKMFLNPARKNQEIVAQSMLSGNTFIMQGNIAYDNFNNALAFTANKIGFCTINYQSIDTTPRYNTEREQYLYIQPVKYEEQVQTDMLYEGIPKQLFDKTFVVFDFETTGLDASSNGITDIGAVKIVNGRIIETFSSLVNPEMSIPLEVTNLTGITDEMVQNERTFSEIIGDFYKFTRGDEVILVAHNSGFDMRFLNKYAVKNNYLFDNVVIDTYALARQKVQLKKYKLANLCEKFQIPLIGAHRALNDAMATAKLFMKLFCL